MENPVRSDELIKNAVDFYRENKPLDDTFYTTPFKRPAPIFDWHAPK